MLATKQFLLLKTSNAFGSNQKLNNPNAKRFKPEKNKVYQVDDASKEKSEEIFQKQKQKKNISDYHVSKNIFYYQSLFFNNFENEKNNVAYFIASVISKSKVIRCRKCKTNFSFNNKLHQHLRVDCARINKNNITLIVETNLQKPLNTTKTIRVFNKKLLTNTAAFKNDFKKFFVNVFNIVVFTNDLKKSFANALVTSTFDFSIENVFIIAFNVDFNKNVDINHDFRDWNYTRIHVVLSFIVEIKLICLNIKVDIILFDKQFFKNQASHIFIRIITFLIFVRDVSLKQHQFDEYVIVFIYISDYNKIDNVVKAIITRKIHLINNLKINMLLNIDLIDLEKIDISISNKKTYIDSCGVIAFLKIKISRVAVQTSIYARKTIVVSSRSKITLSVHYIVISIDKNYLFESNELNVLFYVYLTNVNFKYIFVRNDSD